MPKNPNPHHFFRRRKKINKVTAASQKSNSITKNRKPNTAAQKPSVGSNLQKQKGIIVEPDEYQLEDENPERAYTIVREAATRYIERMIALKTAAALRREEGRNEEQTLATKIYTPQPNANAATLLRCTLLNALHSNTFHPVERIDKIGFFARDIDRERTRYALNVEETTFSEMLADLIAEGSLKADISTYTSPYLPRTSQSPKLAHIIQIRAAVYTPSNETLVHEGYKAEVWMSVLFYMEPKTWKWSEVVRVMRDGADAVYGVDGEVRREFLGRRGEFIDGFVGWVEVLRGPVGGYLLGLGQEKGESDDVVKGGG
ncbi:hypothetical protein GLAREA_04214 [Glarea lozoyensis ATCC 20868]|uniref:Uncharacterized protein n=1 Tax=Glarea lozoyensis (strain ATCC 20868 / MF5171) TaxID=1116229 RepID=S3DLK1_GLAL2|nr:uncharacterized protein GLAREA_04214 [Glarea lozoyensis ATCC 20868]EPE27423.1 hypothetical protein GLAREA_04214 [Glarea lozoyensis ATCC 20868]